MARKAVTGTGARWIAAAILATGLLLLLLWWTRAFILAELAQAYFRAHGIQASLSFRDVSLSGVSGRFALGPTGAPILAAQRIEIRFDPMRFKPYVTDVRLVRPVIRAKITADGKVTFGALQNWIGWLSQGQGGSQYVSPDLTVSLTGLRLLADTPAGFLEWDGDVRLAKNIPVSAHLRAKPTSLQWNGLGLALSSANLDYQGPQASLRITGDFTGAALAVRNLVAETDAAGLAWGNGQIRAQSARFLASGHIILPDADPAQLSMALAARDLVLGKSESHADLRLRATGGFEAGLGALAAFDPAWAKALEENSAQLNLDAAGHLALKGRNLEGQLTAPMTVEGAKGAVLQVSELRIATSPEAVHADFRIGLRGKGLPSVAATFRDLNWQRGDLGAQAQFDTSFDHGAFRHVHLAGAGSLHWNEAGYAFGADHCVQLALDAFRSGSKDFVRDISARLCPERKPLFAGEGAHWSMTARAEDAKAFLPAATSVLDGVAGNLSFEGQGSAFEGHAAIETARLSDRAPALRFHPVSGSGRVDYARGIWRGTVAMKSGSVPLGQVQFTHTMADGEGKAHISAPHLSFAAKGFQPQNLSPSLAMLRDTEGQVGFTGDITWTPQAIASRGILNVDGLGFITPLGRAHDLKTRIAFSSLLPPKTEGSIPLSLSRIDWALPISNVTMRFGLTSSGVNVTALSLDWAQGQVAFQPFAVPLGVSPDFHATAALKNISLENLVAASNLGAKLKVTGKVSGSVPFSVGAQGIRIANGRIAATGPGRLSVDRSLWMQGDAAISSNAVQDFAYQALENLAFDSLSADLNSLAGGRLQVLFHIKGKSAPPKPQTANVPIMDILNGTALYKPIPLPSGTPIDLTLDTSLNFDELLKSYAEAWSEALSAPK